MIRVVLEHRTRDPEGTNKLVEVIRETRAVAKKQPGFIIGETYIDADDPCHVVVISCWQNENQWKDWDESRDRLDIKWKIEELLAEPYTAVTLTTPGVIWQESIQHVF